MTGAGAGEKARAGFFWQAGLVAGLQAGWALQATTWVWDQQFQPLHAPGHPTSVCHEGVNGLRTLPTN